MKISTRGLGDWKGVKGSTVIGLRKDCGEVGFLQLQKKNGERIWIQVFPVIFDDCPETTAERLVRKRKERQEQE